MPVVREVSAWLSAAIGGLLLLYPILVYIGLNYFGASGVALIVIGLCALRLAAPRLRDSVVLGRAQLVLVCAGAGTLAGAAVWHDSLVPMLYYPVLMNAVLLGVFAFSVVYPPTIVERIARLRERDLPADATPYLRRVTLAWIAFFACNGAAAFYTATRTSVEIWALYNGVVAYALIGGMFGAELLIRTRTLRKARP